MKRILITGKGSYIGSSFHSYLDQFPNDYYVEELDMVDGSWRNFDFSGYDVVYHVAGLAHIKEKKENKELYFKVNRDLAIEVAKKAKKEGIDQFIFMSSMSVYGLIYSDKPITSETKVAPNTYYGMSKYEAEKGILSLKDSKFKVCILRPPMVYGNNSPGNMTKLLKVIEKLRIFPEYENKRSSIEIEHLLETIKRNVDCKMQGVFFPQNNEYLCTYRIVKEKMKEKNIKVHYTKLVNPLIHSLIGKNVVISKMFGNLIYSQQEK